jgi:predicted PurR-regulated permease PerM
MLGAFTVKPVLVIWVLVLYLVVTQLEAHVIAPAFYGRAIGLRPAVVLVALLVGVKAGGVVGVLFAIPVAVMLVALITEARAVWQEVAAKAVGGEDVARESVSASTS